VKLIPQLALGSRGEARVGLRIVCSAVILDPKRGKFVGSSGGVGVRYKVSGGASRCVAFWLVALRKAFVTECAVRTMKW